MDDNEREAFDDYAARFAIGCVSIGILILVAKAILGAIVLWT